MIKNEEEYKDLSVTESDNGDWRVVRDVTHKPASLIVFRYNGTLFPSLEPQIVEHSTDYKVKFDQAVSNGDANFNPVTDPRVGSYCVSSIKGFNRCLLNSWTDKKYLWFVKLPIKRKSMAQRC